MRINVLVVGALLLCSFPVKAQKSSLFQFNELSAEFYLSQKDSLKKSWFCAPLYENKATQKKYKEIWEGRTDFLLESLSKNEYLYNKELNSYVESILEQLVKGNKQLLPQKPLLLMDRSTDVNAYAIGGNVFAVNMGMMSFVRTREELALVLAHELSHNILQHPENSMKKKAEWLTSEEYKASLNAVLDSKYERYSRLKKVMEEYGFGRSRHQRYKESEADSLAVTLLKNANIAFDPGGFLRLDSSDLKYRQALKQPLKNYFSAYGIALEDAWLVKRTKGLSARVYNFKDSTVIQDSLKTHPDCEIRYEKTKKLATPGAVLTAVPADITGKANKMIVWQLYKDKRITQCIYSILLEKDKGNTDPWYDFMFYNAITGLTYADKTLSRFNAINVIPKEYISSSYNDLQTLLEKIPREKLQDYCKQLNNAAFWSKLDANEKAFKNFMYDLALDTANDDKVLSRSAKAFSDAYAGSPYREFTSIFEKK